MVVDDHDLVRHGIVSLLNSQLGIEVVAEASSGEMAIEHCRSMNGQIQVILMDINMPGIGGLEATHRISKAFPETGIIIITVHADGPLPKKLLQGGARGYLTKGNSVEEMVTAITDVQAGGQYIAKDIAQQLALSLLPGDKSLIDNLSHRELQVMMMITEGHKNNDISNTLNLSPKTVSTYRRRLHEKLEVSNDVEMLHLAIKHGIVDSDLSGK
jgi:two-component system invasion response regulator UvrY